MATGQPITQEQMDQPVDPAVDQEDLRRAINTASDAPSVPSKWNLQLHNPNDPERVLRSPKDVLLAHAGLTSLPPGFVLDKPERVPKEEKPQEPVKVAPTPPEGFVLDAPPTKQKKTMYDIVTGPNVEAKVTSPEQFDTKVSTSDYLINAAKKGLMAVPGLMGTLTALKREIPVPKTTVGGEMVRAAAEAINPLSIVEKMIEYEQSQQKPGEAPYASGEYLAQKLLGAKDMKPPSKAAEYAGDVTEFVASAPFGPAKTLVSEGVVPAAKLLAKLTATAGGAVAGGEVAQRTMGEGPGTKAVGEVASIVPMALMKKWGSLLTKEGRDIAKDTVADIKGSASGGVGGLMQQAVTNRLAKGIQEYPASIANIKEATDLQGRINATLADADKLQMTAGRATGSPRVVADEFAARRSSAEAVSNAIEQDKRNAAAVLSYMQLDQKANVSRKAAIDAQINKSNAKLAALEADEKEVVRQAQRVAQATVPKMTPQARGATLLEQRVAIKGREDAVVQSLYGAAKAEADRIGAMFSPDAIQLKARELSANPILAYDETNLPSVVRNARIMLSGEGGEVAPSLLERGLASPVEAAAAGELKQLNYGQVTSLREAVNQDIATELRSTNPNKRQRLRALTEMKNTVNGAIAESEHEGVKKLYGAATNYYRDTYSPMFNKGINAKLAMTDAFGEQRVIDEKILDQYATNVTNATRFVNLFNKNPEALAAMEDHLLDRFSQAVVKDGQIDPRRYTAWVQKNAPVLRVMDAAGVKSLGRFQNVAAKAKELADRQAVLQSSAKAMAKDELSKLLGTNDHAVIVETALSNPAAMGRLTNALGQEGSKALSTSVMRDLMSKITYPPGAEKIGVDWPQLSKWLKDNSTSTSIMFKRAFGEKEGAAHLQRLKDSARLLEIMDRVKTPSTIAADSSIGKDPFREKIGIGFRTMFNMLRAVKTGRTSEADMAVTLGGQSGSFFLVKAYNEMLQSIASDPESSKYLLTLAKTGGKPILTKAETAAKAKAISGLIGKVGYYWLGGRYYGPSAKVLAPVMAQQQVEQPN